MDVKITQAREKLRKLSAEFKNASKGKKGMGLIRTFAALADKADQSLAKNDKIAALRDLQYLQSLTTMPQDTAKVDEVIKILTRPSTPRK